MFSKDRRWSSVPVEAVQGLTITGTSLIALLLAVNLIILQVPLISNTFNTIFGEGGRVLQSGDPGTAEYFTPTEGIGTKSGRSGRGQRGQREDLRRGASCS